LEKVRGGASFTKRAVEPQKKMKRPNKKKGEKIAGKNFRTLLEARGDSGKNLYEGRLSRPVREYFKERR